jgi:hypothetical protein
VFNGMGSSENNARHAALYHNLLISPIGGDAPARTSSSENTSCPQDAGPIYSAHQEHTP